MSENLTYFNFLNIPGKLTRDEVLTAFSLNTDTDKFSRFYKKYLYWQLVSENKEFCDEFEQRLKSIKFNEDTKLRYEYLPKSLKSTIIKKIQQHNYNKESAELKASPDKLGAQVSSGNNNESGRSWRKQSNDLTGGSGGKDSKTTVTNPRFDQNKNSFNDLPIKRERFNSDGDRSYQNQNYKQPVCNSYSSIFSNPIRLDYTNLVVKYNTARKNSFLCIVTNKYTNKEIFEIFEKINSETTKKPDFALFVDDVCNESKKQNLQSLIRSRLVILSFYELVF